jgi:hypothetical protein
MFLETSSLALAMRREPVVGLKPWSGFMEIPEGILPDDWEEAQNVSGLVCPCGYTIELDGNCPNGHESPLKKQGLI